MKLTLHEVAQVLGAKNEYQSLSRYSTQQGRVR